MVDYSSIPVLKPEFINKSRQRSEICKVSTNPQIKVEDDEELNSIIKEYHHFNDAEEVKFNK
jgi:hypothetical protein